MDVTLVLTHRCNLACEYCYAGEHYRREMDDATMDRGLDLLFADGAQVAQLGFFGGEPFLAFPRMQRAVAGAQARAKAAGARLLVQITTNGTLLGPDEVRWIVANDARVTVSIDGVREAHELTRPRAGGASSWDATVMGLRALRGAGLRPEAMMVITPATAPFVFRSVQWLWNEGVRKVRGNLELGGRWNLAERDDLRAELVAVGRELLWRQLRGEQVMFTPFETAFRSPRPRGPNESGSSYTVRQQVVVATGGNLYPCAPMVGEDRDAGGEAGLRLGQLADGAPAVIASVQSAGVGCGDGRGCACAAYLETGDPAQPGPNGLWYQRVCTEVGAAAAAGLAEARRRAREFPSEELRIVAERPREETRRGVLRGLILGAGGLALAGGVVYSVHPATRTAGRVAGPAPAVPAHVDATPVVLGQIAAPTVERPPPTPPPVPPIEPPMQVRGGIGPPPAPPPVVEPVEPPAEEIHVKGEMKAPVGGRGADDQANPR